MEVAAAEDAEEEDGDVADGAEDGVEAGVDGADAGAGEEDGVDGAGEARGAGAAMVGEDGPMPMATTRQVDWRSREQHTLLANTFSSPPNSRCSLLINAPSNLAYTCLFVGFFSGGSRMTMENQKQTRRKIIVALCAHSWLNGGITN